MLEEQSEADLAEEETVMWWKQVLQRLLCSASIQRNAVTVCVCISVSHLLYFCVTN